MTAPQHRRALVVYESMFGNTEQVADAVSCGLQLAGVDVELVEVGSAPEELPRDLDLLVLGAPTHAFSLSRPSTRESAVAQGADRAHSRIGLREWLAAVHFDHAHAPDVVAFDTRVTKVRWLPKAAGPTAVRLAHKHGLEAFGKPEGFLVDDIKGPLVEGELERAVAWGRQLAATCTERAAAAEVSGRP
jgi:hypothetical protein